MPDLVTLHAPTGTDITNHGTTMHRVDNDGTIRVTREVAGPILHNGGFYMDKPEPTIAAESGFIRMMYADAVAGDLRTFNGVEPDEDGIIRVPLEFAAVAHESHGLVHEGEVPTLAHDDKLAAELTARDQRIAELEAQVTGLEAKVAELTAPDTKAKAKG